MIDFALDDGSSNIRQMMHWFAETELRPIALQADRDHHYPESVLRKMMEYGLVENALPGGSGDGGKLAGPSNAYRGWMVGAEELAWGDPSGTLNLPGPGLGGGPMRLMGTPEQKKRFFAIFRNRDTVHYGAYALTEPSCGTDVSAIQTTAVKDGDAYVLNGTKCFVTNGAKADWVVVFATVDRAGGRAAHRAFAVERGTPGFRVGKIEEKMGLRASETAELVLDNCRVPIDNLLGGEAYYTKRGQSGFTGAMQTFDITRPGIGAMAVGIARGSYELARDHVRDNYMIHRAIPRYHLLTETLARMQRRVHAARLMCWRAAWLADTKQPNSKEASMAKAYAAQAAMQTCADAVQIVGATGTTQALLCEKFFRDIKVYDIFEGTAQAQRIVIAKRTIEGFATL